MNPLRSHRSILTRARSIRSLQNSVTRLQSARDLLLVYDDLDLPLGKYLFSTKTPKVHQGVLSVQAALGQQSFTSLRLGIDERERPTRIAGGDYVLSNFTKEQLQFLEQQLFPQVCLEVVSQWL